MDFNLENSLLQNRIKLRIIDSSPKLRMAKASYTTLPFIKYSSDQDFQELIEDQF